MAERDAGLTDNLKAKQALLAEAEALVPVTDLKAAKGSLRLIQERWEKAGHVPRADRDEIEGRLKRVTKRCAGRGVPVAAVQPGGPGPG